MTPHVMKQRAVEDLGLGLHRQTEKRPIAGMRGAIAALLFEDPANLDIRHLWTRGSFAYFRVNWWTTAAHRELGIRRSIFLRVTCRRHGYEVRELRALASA